jgi:hypothetical protein
VLQTQHSDSSSSSSILSPKKSSSDITMFCNPEGPGCGDIQLYASLIGANDIVYLI